MQITRKLKLRSDIFYKFVIVFFISTKISKNLSAKYYQGNKKWLQKNLEKDIKIYLKKKKSHNMVVNVTKNLSEDEKQKLVEYRKKYNRTRKNFFL